MAVMADTAEFPGINIGHGNLHGTKFHFWKNIFIMAFLTLDTRFPVNLSRKFHVPHPAFAKIKSFAFWHSQGNGETAEGDHGEQYGGFFHAVSPCEMG